MSFVNPPAMIEVTARPDAAHHHSVDRICDDCYLELLNLIASQRDGAASK